MTKLKKTQREILETAEKLAVKYEALYRTCGQCTFLAIVEALRSGGIEIFPEETDELLFSGVCGFTGGTSMIIQGTCGAIVSSILVMGLAFGPDRVNQNEARVRRFCANIQETILDKFKKEYGSILCRDILNKNFGRVWNLADDEASNDFLQISHGCAIRQSVAWTTEIILEKLSHSPG